MNFIIFTFFAMSVLACIAALLVSIPKASVFIDWLLNL